MSTKVTIQIVTFNSGDVINSCLTGVQKQTFSNWELQIIDNASTDETLEQINASSGLKVKIINNCTNRGFAAAHNQGFRISDSKYILVLNPDVILTPTFTEELVKYLESHPQVGAVCGKLLRLDGNIQPTNILDSTGLIMRKNRRAFDRGQGEVDRGQYNRIEEVFGCSGAAVMYRREMLEDIKLGEDYFDESFFAYKEDVDLAWRSQLSGWKAVYVPTALAYHGRGWQPGKRSEVPRFIQIHSYQNRYLMLLKNEEWPNLLLHFSQIFLYEVAAIIYALVRTPYLLMGWSNLFKLSKSTLSKRTEIMQRKKTSASYLRRWFN